MKRFLVTILSILYLASASGAMIHIHYCMGKLVSASLLDKDEDACGKCGMKKGTKKNCCKDEHKIIKASGDHAVSKNIAIPVIYTDADFAVIPFTQCRVASPIAAYTPVALSNGPPREGWDCPIYLAVQNFRL